MHSTVCTEQYVHYSTYSTVCTEQYVHYSTYSKVGKVQ